MYDMNRIAEIVREIKYNKNQTPVILVLSDFDPSGEEIHSDVQRRLRMLSNVEDLIIEKVMVTREQIERYNLPHTPESQEEIQKLQRDPRFKKFSNLYGLMRVELDAMTSLQPEEAKRILIQAINKYFNQNIYQNITMKRLQEMEARARETRKINEEILKKILGEK